MCASGHFLKELGLIVMYLDKNYSPMDLLYFFSLHILFKFQVTWMTVVPGREFEIPAETIEQTSTFFRLWAYCSDYPCWKACYYILCHFRHSLVPALPLQHWWHHGYNLQMDLLQARYHSRFFAHLLTFNEPKLQHRGFMGSNFKMA